MLAALTVAVAKAAEESSPLVAVLLLIITTLVGLLGWVVRLILTGRLVPGGERDYWREFAFEEQAQKRELMVTGQVVRGVVRSLPEAPPGGDPE